jgi:hypothetical protein
LRIEYEFTYVYVHLLLQKTPSVTDTTATNPQLIQAATLIEPAKSTLPIDKGKYNIEQPKYRPGARDHSSEGKPNHSDRKVTSPQANVPAPQDHFEGFREVPRKDIPKKSYIVEEGIPRKENDRSDSFTSSGRGRGGRGGREDRRLDSSGRKNEFTENRKPGNDDSSREIRSAPDGRRGGREGGRGGRGPPPSRVVTIAVSDFRSLSYLVQLPLMYHIFATLD